MSEPKVAYVLKQVVFDSGITVAAAVDLLAAEDIDDMTGYASTTEAAGAVLTNAAGGGTTGLVAIATRLEHPRNIRLTQVVSGLTGGYCRLIGIGMDGQPASELFSLLVASGSQDGNVAFLRVDEVHVWGVTGTLNTSDTLAITNGPHIGLPLATDEKLFDVVKERFNAADIVVATSGINRTYGTYHPTSTLDGSKALEIWYVAKRLLNF
jgi:hypothetical protein